MGKIIHINLRPYRRLSNANFKFAFGAIITALTGNSNFISPSPSLSELIASMNAFAEKAAAVKAKDFTMKPDRDLIRKTMMMQLVTLSAYCRYTALRSSSSIEEAVAKIQSANFVVGQQGGAFKGRPLPAPGKLQSRSLSQAVEIRFEAVKKARMYIILKTVGLPNEKSEWTQAVTIHTRHIFQNIPPGQIITCIVYAFGAAGKGQPSNYISQVAGL